MARLQEAAQDDGNMPAITGPIDYSKAIKIFPKPLEPWRSAVLAYGASLASTTVGFPMDTIKIRMQTHKNFHGYIHCIKSTFEKEGILGFYRGITAPLLSTSLSKSLSVSIFIGVKPMCYDLIFGRRNEHDLKSPLARNAVVCFASGVISGCGVTLFACPFEFIKIYSQIYRLLYFTAVTQLPNTKSRNEIVTTSTMKTIKDIVAHESFKGLYSGFRYHLLRDSLSSGIYFSIYESMKLFMNKLINSSPDKPSQISIALAGGLSGTISWVLIFPIDTTKSLVQRDAVANIIRKKQGLAPVPKKDRNIHVGRNIYKGLGISVMRSFIVNMVFFQILEFSMSHFV